MSDLLDFLMNLDSHLQQGVTEYGAWVYIIIFLFIFAETGLIIFGILPGDSLLFASASLAANDILSPLVIFITLPAAAFAGDQINYLLGRAIGKKIFSLDLKYLLKKENLEKAKKFYDRKGNSAIIFGRFVPVVRSFIPFVAATSGVSYIKFLKPSIAGSLLWSLLFLLLGYFFGKVEFVKDHLYLVIVIVVLITLIPVITAALKRKHN
jgi:membrane-associated protein